MLALASPDDGAIMELHWCNSAFTRVFGYSEAEALGQRGTIMIGADMDQGTHLYIIEKLMNWENFSVKSLNNRKSGEQFFQRMKWVHLSDAETGNHWWLCSIVELDAGGAKPALPAEGPVAGNGTSEEYLRALEKVHRLEKENARLHELARSVTRDANEDVLTGLSNRRHFEVELKTWIRDLKEQGREFAVLYVDLDRFKLVNDTLGHEAGDKLLVTVAGLLRELTDDTDLVARLGGDEFVILKPLGDSALRISSLADDIVQRLRTPMIEDGTAATSSASVGVAIAKTDMEDPETIVADADAALYHAKAQGKARWSFFTQDMHAEAIAQKKLVADLLAACDRREFIPYFQPMIDAETGRIACAEALVRWAHPTRGILGPDTFLDTAEAIGIVKRVDEIVLAGMRDALAAIDGAGVELPRVAVNVSSARLADPAFIHDLKSSGISPGRLTVEILESVYLDRMCDVVRWAIDELEDLGATIALDDFGTGHASVRGLLKIRPAILKIDRHFIQPIVKEEGARALASSIIGIGKSLGMRVVAEGVESEDHAWLVREMGCDYLQGFFFGRPMSGADLRDRLAETGGQFWTPGPRSRQHVPAPRLGRTG